MTRADLRAAALLAVVVVHGIAAAPLARKADRKMYERPLAKDEIRRWQSILESIGISATEAELAEFGYQFARITLDTRHFFMDPFKPLFHITGTGQAWALFTYPDRYPGRLLVEGRTGDSDWTTLYAALDPDHAFRRDQLVYRRVRGVYDSSSEKVGSSYDPFCSWIAAEVFAEFPQYDAVRVHFQRIHTQEPNESGDTLLVEGDLNPRLRSRP